jgi:tetratricopeptide (TPR) repeat protein
MSHRCRFRFTIGHDLDPDPARTMTQPVFISYARDASREHAQALHAALGGQTAFLDTADIEPGERFPEALVDALFGAKVVVIFAEPKYFTRWYCLLEFRIARTPFLRVAERPGATAQEKADALRGLVIAMPPRGVDPMIQRFPPLVQGRNWPDVDDIDTIAALVMAELDANPPTLRERYAAVADADWMRGYLLNATHLPPPRRIGNVPFVPQYGLPPTINEAFVGRADDLWRIHDLLWTERGDPTYAAGLTGAIEATGGFGKTRLALEYLYRFGPEHFRGGLFWIDAESDPELQLYEVLRELNPDAPAIEAIRQVPGGVPTAVARAVRTRAEDAPTPLFIIDNVPEPQPDQPPRPLETWCPVLGEVPVLTTSRTRVALGAGGSVVSLPIDTLDPASAVDLLTTSMSRAALTNAEWDEIAAWVGYLPLALEVLNRLLRSGEMSPRAVLELSRTERPSAAVDAAMDSIRGVVPVGALRGITEAFSASYNLLTPEEQYAARLIAWMAPAPIPTFVIDAFGDEVFTSGIRAKLRGRSFVTEIRDGADVYFGAMHRVLGDFVRAQSEAWKAEVEIVVAILTQLIDAAEGRGTEGSARVLACAPLVQFVFGNWIASLPSAGPFMSAWDFLNHVGVTLGHWGHYGLADDVFATLLESSAKLLGDEHPDTLAATENLGIIRRYRGDLEGAKELHEFVLERTQRIFGEESTECFAPMHNLAIVFSNMGNHHGAKELQERLVEAKRRILGDEHPSTLLSLGTLAVSLNRCGDAAGAEALEERILEIRLRTLGEDHPETLGVMGNLAIRRGDRGDLAGSQELEERVLKVRRRLLGDEHPDTLSSMNNLAVTLLRLSDYGRALELQEHAVKVSRRILGDQHPDTLRAVRNMAAIRFELMKPEAS